MKKKETWKLILGILALVVLVAVYGGDSNDNMQDEPKTENEKIIEPEQENSTSESKPEPNPVSEPVSEPPINNDDKMSLDNLSDLIEIVLSQRFPNYDISNDGKTITVNIWMDGVAIELAAIQENGGDASDESWVALKEGIGAMSDSICELIDTSGREDIYFALNVLNDQNLEKTLLSMLDSVIIYDVLERT